MLREPSFRGQNGEKTLFKFAPYFTLFTRSFARGSTRCTKKAYKAHTEVKRADAEVLATEIDLPKKGGVKKKKTLAAPSRPFLRAAFPPVRPEVSSSKGPRWRREREGALDCRKATLVERRWPTRPHPIICQG